MRRYLSSLLMLLGLSVLAGCQATEGPRPVPVADNVEGIKFKEISPTKWSVWVQLDDSKLQPQKDPEFCWAASVRAIKLHTQGNAPTQEKLYEQHIWTMPAEKRKAGYKHEIIDAMAGGFTDDFNQRYVIDLKDHASLSEKDIVLSLSAGQPVLVGFGSSKVSEQGHVCVIYGVQYEEVEVSLGERLLDATWDIGLDVADWVDGLGDDADRQRQAQANEKTNQNIAKISDAVSGHQYRLTKVYFWDPWNLDSDKDGIIDGGKLSYKGDDFREMLDFSVTELSALAITKEHLEWIRKHDDGAGVYVRNPATRNGDPVRTYSLDEFDPKEIDQLMDQYGLASKQERDTAVKANRQDIPKP